MAADPGRDPLDDAPPFSTWRRIYLAVIGALVIEIALYALAGWLLSGR